MLGHAKATMPSRQVDLDQKSVCRKNQNKRPFPDHSADRAVWAANNWNNLNGAAAPGQLRQTSTWVEVGSGITVIYGVAAPVQPPRWDWCASHSRLAAVRGEADIGQGGPARGRSRLKFTLDSSR
jgi:hypothetical protein